MHIKDVEKLTGLTQKSIRYYENKGLFSIKRDRNNDYREYTEADVEIFRKIKLYRFLGFSIEEIRALLNMESADVNLELQKKADQLEKQNIENDIKKELCLQLKKSGDYNVLFESVAELDGDVMEDVKNSIFKLSYTNLYLVIVNTLILLGPVGWLFINISEKKWDALYLNSFLAIIAAVIIWCMWTHFVRFRKAHREQLKKENKSNRMLIPTAIFSIAICLAVFVGISVLQEKIIMPNDFLFYESGKGITYLFIMAVILTIFLIVALIMNKFNIQSMGEYDSIVGVIAKRKTVMIGIVIVIFIILYCFLTTSNVVTEDKIIRYRPWKVNGIIYDYSDVQTVDAGFSKKGDFHYTLFLKDNKKVTFMTPSTNSSIERYQNDTYLELEELDQKLMDLEIEKNSDGRYSENAYLDQIYIDRFLRIINNK